MTTASVMTTGCLNGMVLAMTPLQRWRAAREFDMNSAAERWFVLIGIVAMLTLAVLLFALSFKRIRQERKASDHLFTEYARKRGLTLRERQMLLETARQAGLKRNEAIFTLGTAFDRGMAKIIEENLADQQATEESRQLKTELWSLREKLGFRNQPYAPDGSPTNTTKPSSRQIPVGKKVQLTRRKAQDSHDIESTVVENSHSELTLRLTKPVKVTFKEYWCVRYNSGPFVWEFDTSVVSYDGDRLVLNHSDGVRFVKRRRFLRVPVEMSALIASFPFEKSLVESSPSSQEQGAANPDSAKPPAATLFPPEFVPAVVTELAGPGLRIESSLEIKAGERILVVFSLEHDANPADRSPNPATPKIVEDVGVVRRTKRAQNGLSIAVELTGLSDSNIDELVRATNAASLMVSDRNRNVPMPGNAEQSVTEHVRV